MCTAAGKVYGIDEELLPAVAGKLESCRAFGPASVLKAEADRDRVRRVFSQLREAGKAAAKRCGRW